MEILLWQWLSTEREVYLQWAIPGCTMNTPMGASCRQSMKMVKQLMIWPNGFYYKLVRNDTFAQITGQSRTEFTILRVTFANNNNINRPQRPMDLRGKKIIRQ